MFCRTFNLCSPGSCGTMLSITYTLNVYGSLTVVDNSLTEIGPPGVWRLTTMGLSAVADKSGIVSTKSKDKFCHEKNFCLVCDVRIQIFKGGKFCRRLNIALIIFSPFNTLFCCARQNIKHFGGIMDHVQILAPVPCFVLLNLAQMADETLIFTASIYLEKKVPF